MVMDIRSLAPGQLKADIAKAEKSKKKDLSSNESTASIEKEEDSVSLTGQSSKISQLIEQMKSAPVLDPDRVSPVKEKINQGKYEIEYEQVANKMLDFETSYYGI